MISLSSPTDLGRALWDMRRGAGLTQVQLAEQVGVTGMTVSLVELGKSSVKLGTLIRLADACGYDVTLTPRSDS